MYSCFNLLNLVIFRSSAQTSLLSCHWPCSLFMMICVDHSRRRNGVAGQIGLLGPLRCDSGMLLSRCAWRQLWRGPRIRRPCCLSSNNFVVRHIEVTREQGLKRCEGIAYLGGLDSCSGLGCHLGLCSSHDRDTSGFRHWDAEEDRRTTKM
jgi:hypothetical protein